MASKAIARSLSATGNNTSSSQLRFGFTLIEMMIVLTIMGIALAVSVPMINNSHEGYMLQRESSRLREVLRMAAFDAVIHGNQWGLVVAPDAYGFVRYNPYLKQWASVTDPVMGYYKLPQFLDLTVATSGISRLPSDYLTPPDSRPSILLLSTAQTTAFTLRLSVHSNVNLTAAIVGDGLAGITMNGDQ